MFPGYNQALDQYQNLVLDLFNPANYYLQQSGTQPPPANYAYPSLQTAFGQVGTNSPYFDQGLYGAQRVATLGDQGVGNAELNAGLYGLIPYSGQILNTAFDPQQQLYNQLQQQTTDAARAANAAAGLGSSPYGAGVTNQALNNFNINWQNQQLGRQAQGLGAAGQGFTTGGNLANAGLNTILTSNEAPYNFATGAGNATLGAGNTFIGAGNQQYTLPQQVLNDLQSYLGLGQSQSAIAGQLQNQAFNQNLLTNQGIGQLAGGLFNSGGGFGGIGSGIGGLFGGGNQDYSFNDGVESFAPATGSGGS